jgi:hypothetical protein
VRRAPGLDFALSRQTGTLAAAKGQEAISRHILGSPDNPGNRDIRGSHSLGSHDMPATTPLLRP